MQSVYGLPYQRSSTFTPGIKNRSTYIQLVHLLVELTLELAPRRIAIIKFIMHVHKFILYIFYLVDIVCSLKILTIIYSQNIFGLKRWLDLFLWELLFIWSRCIVRLWLQINYRHFFKNLFIVDDIIDQVKRKREIGWFTQKKKIIPVQVYIFV